MRWSAICDADFYTVAVFIQMILTSPFCRHFCKFLLLLYRIANTAKKILLIKQTSCSSGYLTASSLSDFACVSFRILSNSVPLMCAFTPYSEVTFVVLRTCFRLALALGSLFFTSCALLATLRERRFKPTNSLCKSASSPMNFFKPSAVCSQQFLMSVVQPCR